MVGEDALVMGSVLTAAGPCVGQQPERVTGTVLVAFGVRIAVDAR